MESPEITPEILRWLEELFPEELPMSDSPVDYYRAQGRQQVMRKLRSEYNRQDMRR